MHDAIVVGAGLSGAVMAERLASTGKRVLVIEQRPHVAGNCYDFKNSHGITIHQYGPHLFHTDNETVWEYLSGFTEWTPYEHKVLANIDGKLGPIPFNLDSLDVWFEPGQASNLATLLLDRYGENTEVSILKLKESENPDLKTLAEFIYRKLFLHYTVKQWGVSPDEISPDVIARVPVRINRDNRYFKDRYQAIPSAGYTRLVENILANQNIEIENDVNALTRLRLDLSNHLIYWNNRAFEGLVIYTGMLDELFHYCFGELEYRSLQFKHETINTVQFQPATTVNYPNEPSMTRITEFKHILGEQSDSTCIVREYPQDYDKSHSEKNIPYYPMFNEVNLSKYQRYKKLANKFSNLLPLGRLAEYRYFDMDDAVANALNVFNGKSN